MRALASALLLLLAACGSGSHAVGGPGSFAAVECVPFARQVSGLHLYGDAYTWWDQADGVYPRGADPAPRSVLVFRRTGRLPSGHVSVVSRVVNDGEIQVTQANWVHHRIGRNDPVVDVSSGHDWTAVRVWWAPANALGATTYPTYGFVGPAGRRARSDLVADALP